MPTSAWIFMLSVWTLIIGATAYSFFKLLTSKRQLGTVDEEDVVPPR